MSLLIIHPWYGNGTNWVVPLLATQLFCPMSMLRSTERGATLGTWALSRWRRPESTIEGNLLKAHPEAGVKILSLKGHLGNISQNLSIRVINYLIFFSFSFICRNQIQYEKICATLTWHPGKFWVSGENSLLSCKTAELESALCRGKLSSLFYVLNGPEKLCALKCLPQLQS